MVEGRYKFIERIGKGAFGTVLLMVLISAMNGLSVAGLAIGATIALPEMLKRDYDKVMVTDGKFTTTGSSNLDDVALYHVYEMNVNVEDEKFAKDTLDRLFTPDIAKSKPMKVEDISKMQIITGKFWNLFSHFI